MQHTVGYEVMNVIVAPDNRAALWAALPTRPVNWEALPEEGITLPGGLHFELIGWSAGLYMTLLQSDDFFWQLEHGEGDFTDEEREAGPFEVMDRFYDEASKCAQAMVAEATRFLGEPDEQKGGATWRLEDRTIYVTDMHGDKESPIEVIVALLPPGVTDIPF